MTKTTTGSDMNEGALIKFDIAMGHGPSVWINAVVIFRHYDDTVDIGYRHGGVSVLVEDIESKWITLRGLHA